MRSDYMDYLVWIAPAIASPVIAWMLYVLATNGVSSTVQQFKRRFKGTFIISCGFALGFAIALLFRDKDRIDALIGFVGAFCGVAFAIAGTLWVFQVQDEKSRQRTIAAIAGSLRQLEISLEDLHEGSVSFCNSTIAQKTFTTKVRAAVTNLKLFRGRVAQYRSHLIELDSQFQNGHALIERTVHLLITRGNRVIKQSKSQTPNLVKIRLHASTLQKQIVALKVAADPFIENFLPDIP